MGIDKNMLQGGFIENARYLLQVTDTPQRELGTYLDTDTSLVSRYLGGKTEPSYIRVMQIADFFSRKLGQFISLDELVGRTEDKVFKVTKAAEPNMEGVKSVKVGQVVGTLDLKKKKAMQLMRDLLEQLEKESE